MEQTCENFVWQHSHTHKCDFWIVHEGKKSHYACEYLNVAIHRVRRLVDEKISTKAQPTLL